MHVDGHMLDIRTTAVARNDPNHPYNQHVQQAETTAGGELHTIATINIWLYWPQLKGLQRSL